jgi:hypothetical protein
MAFILPGFPTEVGKEIEFPNIAELLMYPMFQGADISAVYEYGTDFLKHLLDQAPLRHDRKFITVRSHVQLVYPGMRCMTNPKNDTQDNEWHIDINENSEGFGPDYERPYERVHLISFGAKSLTEFNKNPIECNIPGNWHISKFNQWINQKKDDLGVVPQMVEPSRWVTFENHLHRPSKSTQVEFRYVMRIRETDRGQGRIGKKAIIPSMEIFDIDTQERIYNVLHEGNYVKIQFPPGFRR